MAIIIIPIITTVMAHDNNINSNGSSSDCKNDKSSNISIELVDESTFHLKGSFTGPEGTPYEGGRYEVVSQLLC